MIKTTSPAESNAPTPTGRARLLTAATGAALLTAALMAGCATPPAADVVTKPSPLNLHLLVNYPAKAQYREVTGTVRLRVGYDAAGAVQEVRIVESSGDQALDAEALRATQAMRVQPGTRNGVPEAGVMIVPIRFALE